MFSYWHGTFWNAVNAEPDIPVELHYCGYAKREVNYNTECAKCDIYNDCWGNVEGLE